MSAPGDNEQLRRVTRTLAEMTHALGAVDQPEARLLAALRMVKQVVPHERCGLLEVVPSNGTCVLYTTPVLSAVDSAALRSRLVAILRLMNDDETQGSRVASQASSPERGHLAIPVVGLHKIIGILFVEQTGSYDDDHLRLLTVIAAQLSFFLTTLRLREEEIEQARQLGIAIQQLEQTDRKKDEFLAMLGHELRNPLGAINSALHLLDSRGAAEVSRYHRVIDRQIKHLSRIVDDLLDASRVRLGKIVLERRLVDLNEIAQRWLDAYGGTDAVRAHEVQVFAAAHPVYVHGDPVRLEQILSNLLSNALKYTPTGGHIQVTTELEAGRALLRVRDDGIGISAEVLATVFDLFTQADESLSRSQGGLGLGLPLVRSLVEKHGGTVRASSEGLGRGTEVVISLPALEPGSLVAAHADDLDALPAPTLSLRILIVEDNDDAREVLGGLLRHWGHEVAEAMDGLRGVSAALSAQHDVLLIDIGLPGLDGYEVARRVRRERGNQTPFLLAMTGYGQPEDRRRAIDAGFHVHMVKPLDVEQLRGHLARVRHTRPRS